MSDTPNLALHKPNIGDTGWGDRWNENADTLDEAAAIVRKATVTLSAAQIKNLASSFYSLASAPGAGKMIALANIVFDYKFGTIAYTDVPGNAGVLLCYGNTAPAPNLQFALGGGNPYNAMLESASTMLATAITLANISRAAVENLGIYITNDDGGNDFADGDGSLTVTAYYTVLDLA